MYKKIAGALMASSILLMPAIASAHVIVSPDKVGVAQRQIFSISVPNEEQTEVTNIKLDVPEGLNDVTPTVKPGWTITTETNGDPKEPSIKSITWSGGTIPVGQRDDFTFKAQVPSKSTSIIWKAHQTYADGSVVNWDQKPTADEKESADSGPYSVTKIVNDLAATSQSTKSSEESDDNNNLAFVFSLVALSFSVTALAASRRKK